MSDQPKQYHQDFVVKLNHSPFGRDEINMSIKTEAMSRSEAQRALRIKARKEADEAVELRNGRLIGVYKKGPVLLNTPTT